MRPSSAAQAGPDDMVITAAVNKAPFIVSLFLFANTDPFRSEQLIHLPVPGFSLIKPLLEAPIKHEVKNFINQLK
jgi:hypothetical protein